MIKLTRIAS